MPARIVVAAASGAADKGTEGAETKSGGDPVASRAPLLESTFVSTFRHCTLCGEVCRPLNLVGVAESRGTPAPGLDYQRTAMAGHMAYAQFDAVYARHRFRTHLREREVLVLRRRLGRTGH